MWGVQPAGSPRTHRLCLRLLQSTPGTRGARAASHWVTETKAARPGAGTSPGKAAHWSHRQHTSLAAAAPQGVGGTWEPTQDPLPRAGSCAAGRGAVGTPQVLLPLRVVGGSWEPTQDPLPRAGSCAVGRGAVGTPQVLLPLRVVGGSWEPTQEPLPRAGSCAAGRGAVGTSLGVRAGCSGSQHCTAKSPASPQRGRPGRAAVRGGAGSGRDGWHARISRGRVNWSPHTSQRRAAPIKGRRRQNGHLCKWARRSQAPDWPRPGSVGFDTSGRPEMLTCTPTTHKAGAPPDTGGRADPSHGRTPSPTPAPGSPNPAGPCPAPGPGWGPRRLPSPLCAAPGGQKGGPGGGGGGPAAERQRAGEAADAAAGAGTAAAAALPAARAGTRRPEPHQDRDPAPRHPLHRPPLGPAGARPGDPGPAAGGGPPALPALPPGPGVLPAPAPPTAPPSPGPTGRFARRHRGLGVTSDGGDPPGAARGSRCGDGGLGVAPL